MRVISGKVKRALIRAFACLRIQIIALERVLKFYGRNKRGIKNIRDIIKAFAPPSENDTEKYIKSVCRWTGYDPQMELTSPVIASMVITAMIRMETGLQLSASHVYEIIINTK